MKNKMEVQNQWKSIAKIQEGKVNKKKCSTLILWLSFEKKREQERKWWRKHSLKDKWSMELCISKILIDGMAVEFV